MYDSTVKGGIRIEHHTTNENHTTNVYITRNKRPNPSSDTELRAAKRARTTKLEAAKRVRTERSAVDKTLPKQCTQKLPSHSL